MLINLKNTKLVLTISSVLFCSSLILTAAAASKTITLQVGQSVNIDDLVVTCQAASADTNTDDKANATATEAKADINANTDTNIDTASDNDNDSAVDEKMEMYKKARALQTEFCSILKYNKEKKECLSTEVVYLDKEALDICKNQRYSSDRIKCFKTIANKVYVEGDLNTARNKRSAESRIVALSTSGAHVK